MLIRSEFAKNGRKNDDGHGGAEEEYQQGAKDFND